MRLDPAVSRSSPALPWAPAQTQPLFWDPRIPSSLFPHLHTHVSKARTECFYAFVYRNGLAPQGLCSETFSLPVSAVWERSSGSGFLTVGQ